MSTADALPEGDKTLLLVDDDKAFLTRLERAMEKRGFAVRSADTVAAGLSAVDAAPPAYAVVDLRLEDGNGLDVVDALHKKRPEARAVVLTGYGNIATAVTELCDRNVSETARRLNMHRRTLQRILAKRAPK